MKTKKPSKPVTKKSVRKDIEKKLDELWSKAVKERDKQCVVCGRKTNLNAHHIFTRKYKSTRWSLTNGITLCFAHHRHLAHSEPEKFRDFLISYLGGKEYEALKIVAYQSKKWAVEELYIVFGQIEGAIKHNEWESTKKRLKSMDFIGG